MTVFVVVGMLWLFSAYERPTAQLMATVDDIDLERWRHDGQQPLTVKQRGNLFQEAPWQPVTEMNSLIN